MKACTSWPSCRRLCTKAPATSASPPVFANGKISELKTHSFNADIVDSLAKALMASRENVQAFAEYGRLGSYWRLIRLLTVNRGEVWPTLLVITPDAMSAD